MMYTATGRANDGTGSTFEFDLEAPGLFEARATADLYVGVYLYADWPDAVVECVELHGDER